MIIVSLFRKYIAKLAIGSLLLISFLSISGHAIAADSATKENLQVNADVLSHLSFWVLDDGQMAVTSNYKSGYLISSRASELIILSSASRLTAPTSDFTLSVQF